LRDYLRWHPLGIIDLDVLGECVDAVDQELQRRREFAICWQQDGF